MLIPRFVQCVTGLFRLLLACSWLVPLVTDLFLACSACYWLVPLVPCFSNVACTHANSTLCSMRYWLAPLVTGPFLACSACYWPVTGLLLACSWFVPLVTDLFLACSAYYWLVPLVLCFSNVNSEFTCYYGLTKLQGKSCKKST